MTRAGWLRTSEVPWQVWRPEVKSAYMGGHEGMASCAHRFGEALCGHQLLVVTMSLGFFWHHYTSIFPGLTALLSGLSLPVIPLGQAG